MKTILEYLNRKINSKKLNILFELDESSLDLIDDEFNQFILEGNRVIYTSNDGDKLRMGNHAVERQDRPVEKGGDGGERITLDEIKNMFIYTWDEIIDMEYDGYFKPFYDKNYDRNVNAWTIECQCWLKNKNNEVIYDGARPGNKTLWAVFMIEEDYNNINVIIKTIFRGETLKHSIKQERLRIRRNGQIEKRLKYTK